MESACSPQNIYRVAQIGTSTRRYKVHPPILHQEMHWIGWKCSKNNTVSIGRDS